MADQNWCYIVVRSGEKVKIDIDDLPRVEKHKWRVTYGTTGRPRVVTSMRTPKGVRSMTLGKFLMSPPAGKQVYPRRFNQGLDYRKQNLIICTLQERQRMLPKKRTATSSQYRGVSYSRRDGRWRAAIEVKGRTLNLGHYESEKDAALAYNEAAKKHFGEMACENRVDRQELRQSEKKAS